jgi:hypothetical protein
MMVSMMNKEQVMKAQNAILTLQDTVDKTHPQYWVFDMITMLMDTKLEKLNETKSIAETAM